MTRTAAELGAGLAPVRAARAISPGERIHVLGIAGAGASAAALHARAAGAIVSGCDPGGPSPYTPAVEAAGIPIAWAHDAAHIAADPPPDRLAVTKALTAVDPHNPELEAAAARGIPIEGWQQLVADAAYGRTLVAVAGTHGKSTTAGWLTWALAEAGLDPAAFVGALMPAALTGGLPATARIGQGTVFVVEADEYAGNFDPYRPDVATVGNIEWDHPDVFADRAAVVAAFERWIEQAPAATVVVTGLDPGAEELIRHLGRSSTRQLIPVVYVGSNPISAADWRSNNSHWGQRSRPRVSVIARLAGQGSTSTRIELFGPGFTHGLPVELPLVGAHNIANALVVAGALVALDVAPDAIRTGLETFPGIGRRLERKGEARGVVVYDDYGHHPTAIRATIAALRQREPDRRLWAVYEPLTFHRTAAMLDDFAAALAEADAVAIADIWASRDPDTTITTPEALAAAVRNRRPKVIAEAPGSVEQTAEWLATNVKAGDAVLVMGGGRSYRIAELLLENLESS